MKNAIGIVFTSLMISGGCIQAGDAEDTANSTAVSIQTAGFMDEEIADQLGAEWQQVAAGVFERRGEDGYVKRVAVGRRGLAADLDRFTAELASREALLKSQPQATSEEDELVRALRTRVAGLEALAARKNAQAQATSGCMGAEFFADYAFQRFNYNSYAEASAGWAFGFGPRVPSESYAYVGVFSGFWPIDAQERFGDSYSVAAAAIATSHFSGCSMFAYAWVAPLCEDAYLSVSDGASCER